MVATASLSSKVTGVTHWHINADESLAHDYNLEFKQPACAGCAPDPYAATPYRSSDHDPVVIGLSLVKAVAAAPGSASVTGSAGDDVITSGAGSRTLTGGAGADRFVFTAGFAGGATITDFKPGTDTISLAALLQGLRIPAADPIGQGYLSCSASGSDALIKVDPDAAGPAAARPVLLLKNLGCASALRATNFSF